MKNIVYLSELLNDEGMFVNGLFSGARTSTDNFTAYINPYLVVSRGGNYTKHIYIGSQRIVSKLGDLDSYGQDPRRIAYAGSEVDGANVDFAGKYRESQQTIKDRYTDFGVEYRGEDNDDYVNGGGFCCDDSPSLRSGAIGNGNDNPELYQYYYHSDHLGSTSLITNLDGEIVQHVEYVPFGEVFIEERNNTWNTPYLFNAKELDEETGLYYYGARYYDSRVSVWLGVDPMWEKYPNVSTYAYCVNNPEKYTDPTGEYPVITITNQQTGKMASQRVLGYSGGTTTQVPLYNVVVTDTENKNFRMTFSVTRDAWTVEQGNRNASNVAFEPKDGNVNHYTGKVMPNGYPKGNGTEALKLTQYGSEVVHAEANQTAVDMGYRNKTDVASGIMLHVGGYYEKSGNTQLAASEGCFGIVNPNNSPTNTSNEYSNNVLNTIINQANKSQADKGKILIIIQKREDNDYPKTKEIP